MSRRDETVEYVIELVKAKTDGAVLVALKGHRDPVWLPNSQIEEDPRTLEAGDTITIPQWLAEDRGLE